MKRLLIRLTWKRFFDAAGEFTIITLVKSWIVMRQLLESELSSHRCKSSECSNGNASLKKPPNEKVISTKMFHKAKGDEVRSRIVAREFADGVIAPEQYAKHATHLGTEAGDQQNDVEGPYTSACVTRCVTCVLPCLACERRVVEASEQIDR